MQHDCHWAAGEVRLSFGGGVSLRVFGVVYITCEPIWSRSGHNQVGRNLLFYGPFCLSEVADAAAAPAAAAGTFVAQELAGRTQGTPGIA